MILGDANLCSQKWNEPEFANKNVAAILKNMLEQEGLVNLDVGNTYQSDHVQANGKIAISALDHVYCSKNLAIKMYFTRSANIKKLTKS